MRPHGMLSLSLVTETLLKGALLQKVVLRELVHLPKEV